MKKIFLVLFLSILFFPTCTIALHCDLRFCDFYPKITPDKQIDLKYLPVYTTYNPKGHTLSSKVIELRYKRYPEEIVEYDIPGKGSRWDRVKDQFYIIPQTILNDNYDHLADLLCGDEFWDEYKYSYEDFLKFTFDKKIDGILPTETVYYCIFSAHKAI